MAHPKRKWSKARTGSHKSNWKLIMPNFVECPQCHAKMLRRVACKNCGYLDGKQVLKVGEEI
ncbi:MAG: 50S ribosomal protein L32 [Clostridiales bacterium]|nr:50S ribosomal protein L32 [Clostridiales bacterium]MBO4580445.1 50S ribosomal protein L32 [Clostridiales bacterium]MBP5654695.1 50S ribosomal protein L32 [Clostridiales bacterium]MCR4671444.1 50S ribosomal protein L32 [Saccharofermentans sp.]